MVTDRRTAAPGSTNDTLKLDNGVHAGERDTVVVEVSRVFCGNPGCCGQNFKAVGQTPTLKAGKVVRGGVDWSAAPR